MIASSKLVLLQPGRQPGSPERRGWKHPTPVLHTSRHHTLNVVHTSQHHTECGAHQPASHTECGAHQPASHTECGAVEGSPAGATAQPTEGACMVGQLHASCTCSATVPRSRWEQVGACLVGKCGLRRCGWSASAHFTTTGTNNQKNRCLEM